jgi:hypothetical protein
MHPAACLVLGKKNSAPRVLVLVLSARRMRLHPEQHVIGQNQGSWGLSHDKAVQTGALAQREPVNQFHRHSVRCGLSRTRCFRA